MSCKELRNDTIYVANLESDEENNNGEENNNDENNEENDGDHMQNPETWRHHIIFEMKQRRESWSDVESSAIENEDKLDTDFDTPGFDEKSVSFTIWTKNYVYFPRGYDSGYSCESVPRNPNGEVTDYIGGGC